MLKDVDMSKVKMRKIRFTGTADPYPMDTFCNTALCIRGTSTDDIQKHIPPALWDQWGDAVPAGLCDNTTRWHLSPMAYGETHPPTFPSIAYVAMTGSNISTMHVRVAVSHNSTWHIDSYPGGCVVGEAPCTGVAFGKYLLTVTQPGYGLITTPWTAPTIDLPSGEFVVKKEPWFMSADIFAGSPLPQPTHVDRYSNDTCMFDIMWFNGSDPVIVLPDGRGSYVYGHIGRKDLSITSVGNKSTVTPTRGTSNA